ncbi:DNA internalization-related competence protein ComEC/Rec2 [Tissierella creatinini]|nr:DNA internalization-related competence protein ComEC/Rec2 [Tissierella creatinini]TJX67190.1 DNA internalization-related competence protein ComEC/Rec2 [Soehngenia saccharolytica]
MLRPLASILIALIIGIITSYFIVIDNLLLFFFLIVILIPFSTSILRKKPNDIWIILLFFILGIILTNFKGESKLNSLRGIRQDYIGIIHERVDYNEEYSRYVVKLNLVEDKRLFGKVQLTIRGDIYLNLGDRIQINGLLKEPNKNTNPKLFNQKLFLLSDGIHNTMSVNDYSIVLIEENNSIIYKLIDNFSQATISLFNKHLSERNAQIMTSIILGKSSLLMEEDISYYRELGLAHVLAVSGLHIGIIAGFILLIFSRIGIKRRYNFVITLGIIWIYIFFIGLPPSAIRAGLMFTILYFSKLSHEPYDGLNSIYASMILCLLLNPYWLFNIGFQLSYAATISLLILSSRISIYSTRIKAIKTAITILGVNIGLLPIQSYYFNSIHLLGIISNVVIVPFLSIGLVLGMIMLILQVTIPILNMGVGTALDMILTIQYKLMEIIYSMDVISFNIFSPGILEIGIYYILILILFRLIDINRFPFYMNKTIFYYLLLFTLILAIDINFKDDIEIDFIDVGQGDSILIKTQAQNFLMDTGGSPVESFDIGKNITLPYLKKQGIFKLQGVIITHFDEDHSQGLAAIIDEIKIDKIFASYLPQGELLKNIKKKNIPIILLKKNDYILLDNNTSLQIIWPFDNIEELSSNNKSLISILNYKDYKVLLTGDIEREVELSLKDDLSKVNILKVPHHGSSTSSSQELLGVIKPEASIISVGRNNFYSHPNDDVIERLQYIGSEIYRTDDMGMIRINFDDSYNITPFLKEKNSLTFFLNEIGYYSILILYFLVSYILVKKYTWRKDCL